MITSRKNSLLKDIRRLRRSKGDQAVLEGPHLIGEAVDAGLRLRSVLATPEFLEGEPGRRLARRLPLRPLRVDGRLLAEVTDSDSPRGIVAVALLPRASAAKLPLVEDGIYLFAEGLQDPGNLGAVARAAEAADASGLCLRPGAAHATHPRALRASSGSLLRFPVAAGSLDELCSRLEPLRPRSVALVPRGGVDLYEEPPLEGCLVLLLGAEGRGLSAGSRRRADLELSVPLKPPVESLNAAVSAAVVLFELRRQRRLAS